MLRVVGRREPRRADRRDGAAGDPAGRRRSTGAGAERAGGAAPAAAVAGKNRVLTSLIGQGYYGTVTPPVDPAQHPGEPGLVHRLYALSAGDQPGAAGGAAELPDHGLRPDRARRGECLAARRGDGGGRGDGALPAGGEVEGGGVLRRPRLPSADDRGDPRPAPRRSAGRWSSAIPSPISSRSAVFGAIFQYPGTYGDVHDFSGADRGAACGGRARLRRGGSAGADAAEAAGRDGGGRRGRLDPALRGAAGLRRAACGLHGGAATR